MKEQLRSYVDLLFAGAKNADDIKQEILQNTLDRYDDLISQNKSPEAAYRLAISGIGDINEILGTDANEPSNNASYQTPSEKPVWKKVLSAIAICLYIMCPIPLFLLQSEAGLCGLLIFVAVATALIIISGNKTQCKHDSEIQQNNETESELQKAINTVIWVTGLCTYFILSFSTKAWYITWVIFPLIGAVQGLVKACIDLKEATKNEN